MSHASALLRGGRLPPPTGPPPLTPYARRFNGTNDAAFFGKGAIDAASQKWGTLATLVRRNANGAWHGVIMIARADQNNALQMEVRDDGGLYMDMDGAGTGQSGSTSLTFTTSDGWAVIGWKKGTGVVVPTFFKNVIGGGFTTEAGSSACGDASSTVTHISVGIWTDGTNYDWANMDYAKVAYWENTVLTDTQLQTLDDSDAAWAALSPTWGATFNQASTGTAVPDDTGHGGGQTTLWGTSVVTTGPALPGYGS